MRKKSISALAGPLASIGIYFLLSPYIPDLAARMAAIVIWVAVWWLTEALHLGVTSLLPFVLMPLLGITRAEEVAMQYMDQIIFLFMGGFFMAYAMEKWGLHKRVAFRIIMFTGNTPSKVLLGVMLTSYLISNWVSNTATVMMLIPAVLAIVRQKELYLEEHRKNITAAILVGLSFSATIGGMGTLVGTPPNMIFVGMYENFFPDGQRVSFFKWMMFGIPFSATLLIVAYFILKKLFIPANSNVKFDMSYIREQHTLLGRMLFEEKAVSVVFLFTVLLWLFREEIRLDAFTIPGWSNLFGNFSAYMKDSTVAIFTAFILFLIPSRRKQEHLLEWDDVSKLPFNIILLFGCGFAMAKGFEVSGLSHEIAQSLQVLQGMHIALILLGVIVTVTVMSELASNTATIQLVLPVVIPLAASLGVNPLLLMLTATFSASLGYMLPVATAANTIVYGSGELDVRAMMKAGIVLDIVGIVLLLLFMLTLGNWVFTFNIF